MHPNPSLRLLAAGLLIGLAQSATSAAPTYSVKDIGPINGSIKAAAMNDKGWITGTSSNLPDGASGAFITGPNGKNPRPLGDDLRPYAINNHGAIAGTFNDARGEVRAFASGKQGSEPHDIGTLGGASAGALAINNHGLVVGYAETDLGSQNIRAFRYDSDTGKMTVLGNCPIAASSAQAVNDKGLGL